MAVRRDGKLVREDGEKNGGGSGISSQSAQPPLLAKYKTFIYLVIFVFIIIILSIFMNTPSGEYREGVVFGKLAYVETDDSCGAWLYCYTYLEFYNQSNWRFVYPVDFVHTLELDRIYGFYYNSVSVGAGISGNPDYWDINLVKIVDHENNILWRE